MIPHALLQPALFPPPCLADATPKVGLVSYLVRLARLAWSVWVGLPLVLVGGVLLALGIPAMPQVKGRSLLANIAIPVLSQLIWSGSYGHVPWAQPNDSPFRFPPLVAGAAPKLSELLFSGPDDDGRRLHSAGVIIGPAPEEACVGVVRDGLRLVERRDVAATWLWRTGAGRASDTTAGTGKAAPGERAILYFVGGGYVSGTSLLGPFPYALLRASSSNTRLLGVQYRHALHAECAFPGALQDGFAAWLYLVRECAFAPENIVVVGDSAGAGLSWSLTAYLGIVDPTLALGVPGKVALFSPWLDLSLSHPGVRHNIRLDLLNLPQVSTARDCYTQNVDGLPPLSPHDPPFAVRSAADLLGEPSFRHLRNAHPLFSPAALVNVRSAAASPAAPPALALLVGPLAARGTRFLIHSGGSEIFADEAACFAAFVRRAGADVVELVERGGWHCCTTMLSPWDGRSVWGRYFGVGKTERRACQAFGTWCASSSARAKGDSAGVRRAPPA